MALTATKLRTNIYKILDQVAETGIPVEITRKRRKLKIIAEGAPRKGSKLSRLVKRDLIRGDPEKLVHMDWSAEWSG